MAQVIVLYEDGVNVPYDGVTGCDVGPTGALHIPMSDGSITFIAPGQWKTAEYWTEEGDE